MFGAFGKRVKSAFSYDALSPKGKRRSTATRTVREDHHTRGYRHTALQENADELSRNLSLAAWMMRRHCDYVASFAFHGRNQDESLNIQIERLMEEDSTPARTDIAGRFGREKMFRLAEQRRVIGGDLLLIKLDDGRMQGIQADLIRDPEKIADGEQWINGVLVSNVGRPLAYGVRSRRGYTETVYDRRINAPNAIHYGFFDRFSTDQVRGVSPLVAALNPLRDVYENFDLALAKSKVEQLFALAFYRDADDSPVDPDEEPNGGYAVDFSGGPIQLDLNPGDRAEVLTASNPSSQFQSFTTLIIQVGLKALDIPYSFYDESHTNFFGSRAAWMHYERSCSDKRDDQLEMRRNYTLWKFRTWVRDGRLVLPPGMRISDIKFEWVAKGMAFFDPVKETKGHIAAIKAGLDTPQRVCRATGTEYADNIDAIAKAQEYARSKNVHVDFDQVIEIDPDHDDDESQDSKRKRNNDQ